MESLVNNLVEDINNPKEEKSEPLPEILFTSDNMESYVEDYYKRKANEERAKREQEVSEHLKGLCGFEEKQPESLDTDELIKRMHAVTKKELESLIKG